MTYFKSSSRAVQKRHAQYTLIVNDIALVIHRPAVPAVTYPESASNVVINTDRAPRASKLSNNHRFVIQKLYHIYAYTRHFHVERKGTREHPPSSSHRSCHANRPKIDALQRTREQSQYPPIVLRTQRKSVIESWTPCVGDHGRCADTQ